MTTITSTRTPTTDLPRYLRVSDLTVRWDVSRKQIHKWRKAGLLHVLRLGRVMRVSVDEVQRFEREYLS